MTTSIETSIETEMGSSPLQCFMPSPTGTRDICRSNEMYFEDGNIVLLAENTAFRVYQGLLAKHSPVFMDMVQVGCSVEDSEKEKYDGCPVVRLSDGADEALQFLKTLHGRLCVFSAYYVLSLAPSTRCLIVTLTLKAPCIWPMSFGYQPNT